MLNSFQLTTPTRRCPTRRGSCSPSALSTPPPARAMLCSRGGFGTLAGEPTCPQRNRHGVFRYPALPSNHWLKSPRPCWVDSLSVSQGSRRCGHGFRPTPGKFPGRPSPPASEKSIRAGAFVAQKRRRVACSLNRVCRGFMRAVHGR